MYFRAVWVYVLTLPVQLQRKGTLSAPYAAQWCLIRCVLVGVLRAPCPQFCEQRLTTFLHMGGTRRVVVLLRIAQNVIHGIIAEPLST